MPLIHIRSLPFESPFDVPVALERVSKDFAQVTGTPLEHVTATWDFYRIGHYAAAGEAARHQPRTSHPLLVELLAPDFNAADDVEVMLRTTAESLSRHVGLPITNVFIVYREARSGRVFDAGEIVRW